MSVFSIGGVVVVAVVVAGTLISLIIMFTNYDAIFSMT
jgi:hypothetical protein